MRSLLFDELNALEVKAVREYLAAQARPAGLEGLYWLYLSEGLVTAAPGTRPGSGRVALELGDGWLKLELFKRTGDLYNEGGGFLDIAETVEILRWAQRMIQELNLRVC